MFIKNNWTNWIDIGHFEKSGHYYIMQMKVNKKTNKKIFTKRSMGFVNDYINRQSLVTNALAVSYGNKIIF